MSTFVIGTDPERMLVLIEPASAFYGTLTRTAGNFVTGATLDLVFSDGTDWSATIVGSVATFDVPVPGGGWTQSNGMNVSMLYTEPKAGGGTRPVVIAKGEVRVQ